MIQFIKLQLFQEEEHLVWLCNLPERDEHGQTIKYLKARLAVCFGGRVAEEIIFGKDNISTGWSWKRYQISSNKKSKSNGNKSWNE